MKNDGRVHIVVQSTDRAVQQLVSQNFSDESFLCHETKSLEQSIDCLQGREGSILVYDYTHRTTQPDYDVEILKKIDPDLRIIILSGDPSKEDGDIIEKGIFYYMSKPVGPELVKVVKAATEKIN